MKQLKIKLKKLHSNTADIVWAIHIFSGSDNLIGYIGGYTSLAPDQHIKIIDYTPVVQLFHNLVYYEGLRERHKK